MNDCDNFNELFSSAHLAYSAGESDAKEGRRKDWGEQCADERYEAMEFALSRVENRNREIDNLGNYILSSLD
jgi:hypothetical protein